MNAVNGKVYISRRRANMLSIVCLIFNLNQLLGDEFTHDDSIKVSIVHVACVCSFLFLFKHKTDHTHLTIINYMNFVFMFPHFKFFNLRMEALSFVLVIELISTLIIKIVLSLYLLSHSHQPIA